MRCDLIPGSVRADPNGFERCGGGRASHIGESIVAAKRIGAFQCNFL